MASKFALALDLLGADAEFAASLFCDRRHVTSPCVSSFPYTQNDNNKGSCPTVFSGRLTRLIPVESS